MQMLSQDFASSRLDWNTKHVAVIVRRSLTTHYVLCEAPLTLTSRGSQSCEAYSKTCLKNTTNICIRKAQSLVRNARGFIAANLDAFKQIALM